MRVAIQGEKGSFHHIAAISYFGNDIKLVCCGTFDAVFDALGKDKADAAIVAAENSIAGSVHPVYDLLLAHDFAITGEIDEHIHHCLIALPNADMQKITRVYSHEMALPQCSDFLDKHLPHAERIEYSDTAASVTHIKALGNPTYAAIASSLAAKLNGLPVLEPNIENFANNVTRFLVLSAHRPKAGKTDKVSLVLETAHAPGALVSALGVFADANINLTKLESRPIARTPWRYQFLIDVEATPALADACAQKLKQQNCAVRILGEYAASTKTMAG